MAKVVESVEAAAGRDPDTVVLDDQIEPIGLGGHLDVDGSGPGLVDDVAERFAQDGEEILGGRGRRAILDGHGDTDSGLEPQHRHHRCDDPEQSVPHAGRADGGWIAESPGLVESPIERHVDPDALRLTRMAEDNERRVLLAMRGSAGL